VRARDFDFMQSVDRRNQNFLWSASSIRACPAEVAFFDECDFLARCVSHCRNTKARVPAANDDDIKRVCHLLFSLLTHSSFM